MNLLRGTAGVRISRSRASSTRPHVDFQRHTRIIYSLLDAGLLPWFCSLEGRKTWPRSAHRELAPLHAAWKVPVPWSRKCHLGPSAKFLWSSGSGCLVLRNNKVLPWGFTRTPSERGSVHALVPLSLAKSSNCLPEVFESRQHISSANWETEKPKIRPTDIEKVFPYGGAACSGMKGSKARPAAFEKTLRRCSEHAEKEWRCCSCPAAFGGINILVPCPAKVLDERAALHRKDFWT